MMSHTNGRQSRRTILTNLVTLLACAIGCAQLGNAATPQASSRTTDWARFRGPGGLGITASKGLPATWSDTDNIAWKTALPGPGASSPIIVGKRVFVTCYRGYGVPGGPNGSLDELQLDILCVALDDGNILWTRTVQPAQPEEPNVRDHGYAGSTPVADNDRLYVFFGKTGVFAYSHQGERLWHTRVGDDLNGWGSAASPILYKDMLIVNASVESQAIVALNKATGKEKWRTDGIQEAWNTPLLTTGPQGTAELIVPIPQTILGLDPATGARLWSCDTGIDWYMVPSAIAHGGMAYCIGGRSGDSLAVRLGGRGDVTTSHRVWKLNKGSNVSSPTLHQGHVYWMHEKRGIAYCVRATDGTVVYEQRIPRAGQVYASPVLADGKLYYLARNGRAFVVAAEPQFKLLATNELEDRGRFDASPAVAGNRLILRSNRFLYCIAEKSSQ